MQLTNNRFIKSFAFGIILCGICSTALAEVIEIGGYNNGHHDSYVFGDYIFELVDTDKSPFQYNSLGGGSEFGTIGTASLYGGDFTLRRLDGEVFYLLSLDLGGGRRASSYIGGNYLTHEFGRTTYPTEGMNGLTGVDSILFSPTIEYIHIYSFNATQVPIPAAAWLFGSGLLTLWAGQRRRKLKV
jgi:hypothetical protein